MSHLRKTLETGNGESFLYSLCQKGELDMAMDVLNQIHISLSTNTYISLLKLCTTRKALSHVNKVHSHLVRHDVRVSGFLGDYLVMSLAKCGGIDDAGQLFALLPSHTVFSWTALISAKVGCDCGKEALEMYKHMQDEGVEPSDYTFVSLFKACANIRDLEHGKKLHIDAYKRGLVSDVFVRSALISMYGKCDAFSEAEDVFIKLACSDTVLWNAMLSVYVEQGQGEKVLHMYRQMHEDFVRPDQLTLVFVLQACCSLVEKAKNSGIAGQMTKSRILGIGHALHADSKRMVPNIFVDNTLVAFYGKCGSVKEAENVFGGLVHRSIVSWNAMISVYIEQGNGEKALLMYKQMQLECPNPEQRTLLFALQACTMLAEKAEGFCMEGCTKNSISLEIGQAIHFDARVKAFELNIFTNTALLSLYGKCGALTEAEAIFITLSGHDEIAWNALMSAYIEQGQGQKVLRLYRQMHKEGPIPGQVGNMLALQACCIMRDEEENCVVYQENVVAGSLEIGQGLHADAHKRGFTSDFHFASALLTLYVKFGQVHKAENVFSMLPQCDIVLWTVMLGAYVDQGQGEMALQLHAEMHKEGVGSDQHSLVFALQACSLLADKDDDLISPRETSLKMAALEIGRTLHAEAHSKDMLSNVFVANALINMYSKCAIVETAENVFGAITERNVGSWNGMLSAYVENGEEEKAFWLYHKMKQQEVSLNDGTITCILRVSKTLEVSRTIHFDVVSAEYEQNLSVAASLIHAYGSCASMTDGQAIFDELHTADLVLWNACTNGHAGEGNFVATLYTFTCLLLVGILPDEVSLTLVLSICSHTGHVLEGLEYFEAMMKNHGLNPNLKHYGILLDLLGRVGDFKRIANMLVKMPVQMNLAMWLCLLGACSAHGNVELAKQAFDNAVKLQPKLTTAYIVMSNIFIDAGLNDNAVDVGNLRQVQAIGRPLEKGHS